MHRLFLTLATFGMLVSSLVIVAPTHAQSRDLTSAARKKMVDDFIVACGVTNQRVIDAMLKTPRHEFVPTRFRSGAYYDSAIPIGAGQTISSPFIVAFMTESLDPQPTDRVLEVGTGSGYQAAVLGEIVADVYTIEIVEELGKRAAKTLKRLGYDNVHARVGDGFQGWPDKAPFNKIIVTCSPEDVPQPLIDQLAEGGRMVIPVGERYQQTLYLFRKRDGKLESEALRPTLFVPMTGRAESMREVQPDPANPQLLNGDFELPLGEDGFVQGWYYERQAEQLEDPTAPSGKQCVKFQNEDVGRSAHLLQGFAVDGSTVRALKISAQVKAEGVLPGLGANEIAAMVVTFYDEKRREVGTRVVGVFRGTQDWHEKSADVEVPRQAREAIFRIGLFGATGELWFDSVRIEKLATTP